MESVRIWSFPGLYFPAFGMNTDSIFVNLSNSEVVKQPVEPGILFSIFKALRLRAALIVARLILSGILLSTLVAFVSRTAFAATLVMSGILFSISVAFVFSAAVVTKLVVTLSILFSISVIFVLQSVFLASPLALGIFLSASSIFFSRPWFFELYCILVTNLLVLSILVSIALTLI